MPVITFPKNSFIKGTPDCTNPCAEGVNLCLPIYDSGDLAFQFFSDTLYNYINCVIYSNDVRLCVFNIPNTFSPEGQPYITEFKAIDKSCFDMLTCGQCFTIKFFGCAAIDHISPRDVFLFETNCFEKICDPCFTSKISYKCNEDSFGFDYSEPLYDSEGSRTIPFFNKIRLPFYLTEPQYPLTRNVFMKSDGSRLKLSARIANSWELIVDYMPRYWHEKLIVALEHDTVLIDNINSCLPVDTQFIQEKEYKIDWQRFLNYPTAPASSQLMLTPYYNVNSNCL